MKTRFGEYIRTLRKNKAYTLTQLAARLDMDSANLSKVETGKRDFDEKRLMLLAIEFDLDINELRDEYFSEFVAKKLYENRCSENALRLAEAKIKYLRHHNVKQTKLKLP